MGAGAAFAGLVWRYRADYKRDVLSKLLSDIQAAADLSTDYWTSDPSKGDLEVISQCAILEARIGGSLERLETAIDAARPMLNRIDTLGMELPWAAFFDNMAGGQFGEPDRGPDLERAKEVQFAAAVLVRDLRVATDRKMLGGRA
ncbi:MULTISPECIES: hypothetical protein [unclassified Mesorhizobium]|uniref:hypothetical protein n=1 Tax=unclassified Mesorhizobium TaxID=325217 RepID=UPI001127D432|nr:MULTISPECIES: hypothetical protein [unclassified Mesorhizobium]TPJ38204.1 hypothetical protein FJ437_30995 [Mesorhizobium sp. B2-6-6]MCA0000978.1 hypothetical protein [Mesorhizobium sp. B264B2A]MCA0004727.1 hypothetical protein [Mesorhizobium sp. B264B1B]MCA0019074.1 hypothetical protein [Mesorhizobium sp. B264B1A]TPJ50975.1 hypothetical protein FJ462_33525 [Mesorhizobium sp. B2-6-7]